MERRTFLHVGTLGVAGAGSAAFAGRPPDVIWQAKRSRFRSRQWLEGLFGDAREHAGWTELLDTVTVGLDGLIGYAHVSGLTEEEQRHPLVQGLIQDALADIGRAGQGLAGLFRGLPAASRDVLDQGFRRPKDVGEPPEALLERCLEDAGAPPASARRLVRRARALTWQLRNRPLDLQLDGAVRRWDRLVERGRRDQAASLPFQGPDSPPQEYWDEPRTWMVILGGLSMMAGLVGGGAYVVAGVIELSSCFCAGVIMILLGLFILSQGMVGGYLLLHFA